MALDTTRRSLHGVAELVLAGPQHRRTGEIALIVEPAGFRVRTEPRLRVDGTDLVIGERRIGMNGATCAKLAAEAGVDVGAPQNLYHDGSGVAADEALTFDPDAAAWIERCWAAGDAALRLLAPEEQPILWPEHFDVGLLLDGVDYGVSPGDAFVAEPYAYVNPGERPDDPFWNVSFGAARPMRELADANAAAVHDFFTEARSRAR